MIEKVYVKDIIDRLYKLKHDYERELSTIGIMIVEWEEKLKQCGNIVIDTAEDNEWMT